MGEGWARGVRLDKRQGLAQRPILRENRAGVAQRLTAQPLALDCSGKSLPLQNGGDPATHYRVGDRDTPLLANRACCAAPVTPLLVHQAGGREKAG